MAKGEQGGWLCCRGDKRISTDMIKRWKRGTLIQNAARLQQTHSEKNNYSVASTTPCSLMPNEASPSGRQGESTTLQMRVVPRPFFSRRRVVLA